MKMVSTLLMASAVPIPRPVAPRINSDTMEDVSRDAPPPVCSLSPRAATSASARRATLSSMMSVSSPRLIIDAQGTLASEMQSVNLDAHSPHRLSLLSSMISASARMAMS